MKKVFFSLVLIFLIVIFPSFVLGTTITVCASGCDSTTIQGGYNLADNGDTIEIQDSRTYTEIIHMNKNGAQASPITLQGKDGEGPTIQRLSGSWENLFTISGNYNVLRNVNLGPLYNGLGVDVTGDHNVVENCTFTDIGSRYMNSGTQGEGIRIQGDYNIVRRNMFYNGAHGCIILEEKGGNVRYNQILNNIINNDYGHGISLLRSGTAYNLVDGNLIHIGKLSIDNHQKSPFQISGSSHNSFRRNVVYDIHTRGVELSTYESVGPIVKDNFFYNNTFYNITTRDDETGNNAWVEISANYDGINTVTGNKFYNNIAVKVGQQTIGEYATNHLRAVWILGYYQDVDAGNSEAALEANDWNSNILKNNCIRVYHNGSYDLNNNDAIYYMYRDGGYWDLKYSVVGVNGRGSMSGNITDDPKFISENTSDTNWWHLKYDSPLIDAGIVVFDTNASIGGWSQLSYGGDAPDIGAYEAGASEISAPKYLRIIK